MNKTTNIISIRKGLKALSPLMVFLSIYLVLSLIANDFYSVPITVAFTAASIYAVSIVRGENLDARIGIFSKGAADSNLLFMIWIFILAGAFASGAKQLGSVQATIDLGLNILPPQMLLPGLFIAACFISFSVGTSVGTIVALVPIASGIARETNLTTPLLVATVVGGAYFGDNLSFISDTTIVATRSMGCRLSDKFRTNLRIVLPAALIVIVIYTLRGMHLEVTPKDAPIDLPLVLPYLFVLATALMGVNVVLVLLLGIVSLGIIGTCYAHQPFFTWINAMGDGIQGMSELIIVTLLAGGMMGVIRHMGGIDFLLQRLTNRIRERRGAELSIASLVVLTDLCTANNTIAILTVGPLAKDIADKYGINPRRAASILDTFSCFAQSFLPYGAQMLMASGLASLNPLEIIPYLYYPMVMGFCALLAILIKK